MLQESRKSPCPILFIPRARKLPLRKRIEETRHG
jgi:hypothetical protein